MLRNILPSWLTATEPAESGARKSASETISSDSTSQRDDPAAEADTDDRNITPKAQPSHPRLEIPPIKLDDEASVDEGSSFPSRNSAQRVSTKTSPPSAQRPVSTMSRDSGSKLMPPPSGLRAPAVNSLRVPSTGPLPNRGPPLGSQQRVNGGLSPNAAGKTPNARGKVLLSPGHSPMDWAALTRGGNISGVSTFERVTPSRLKTMTGRKGKPAWSSWGGKVYNITPYLPFHPGGEAELLKAAGRDGTKLFMDVHPWVNWESMLGACLVGVLVPEDYGENESSLEAMD